MKLLGEKPDRLRRRYLEKEEEKPKVTPLQPVHKTGCRGVFSFYDHRLLSLYRASILGALTLILSYRAPSSFSKYLGGLGVKPPVGPVGQTAKDLI